MIVASELSLAGCYAVELSSSAFSGHLEVGHSVRTLCLIKTRFFISGILAKLAAITGWRQYSFFSSVLILHHSFQKSFK